LLLAGGPWSSRWAGSEGREKGVDLVGTTHPDTRSPKLKAELEETIHDVNWRFLNIVSTSKGGKEDKVGKVEFVADYFWNEEPQQLHECSRFKRHKGTWKYLDSKG
jgi:SEC-C motif-containing protein